MRSVRTECLVKNISAFCWLYIELNFKLDFRCEMFCLCLNFNKLRLGNIPVFAALKFKFRKLNQEPRQLSVFSNQFFTCSLCSDYSILNFSLMRDFKTFGAQASHPDLAIYGKKKICPAPTTRGCMRFFRKFNIM